MVLSWLALILASLAVVSSPTPSAGGEIEVQVYPLTTKRYEVADKDPVMLRVKAGGAGDLAIDLAIALAESCGLFCEELATIEVEAPPGGLGDVAPLTYRLTQEARDRGGNAVEIKTGKMDKDTHYWVSLTARVYRIRHPRFDRPIPRNLLSLLSAYSLDGKPPGGGVLANSLREYVANPEKAHAHEAESEKLEAWNRELAAHPFGKALTAIWIEVAKSTGTLEQRQRQFRRRVAKLRQGEWNDDVLYADLYQKFEVHNGTWAASMLLGKPPHPGSQASESPSPSTGTSPSFSPQPMLLDRFRPVGGAR